MKKQIQHISFSILIFIGLCSCASSNFEDINNVVLNICEKKVPISNIAHLAHCVQLKDCGNNSIITGTDRVICWEGNIYVFDDANDIITCNDMSGKMLASTQKYKGHGNNEYIHLSDMSFDETTGQIYALCDTPSEIIIFDKNLQIKSVQTIEERPIEMCVDSTHIMLLCRNLKKDNYEVLCLKKGHLDENPEVILSSKIVVNKIMGIGRNLTYSDGECWVSFPFNNCVYKISNGKIDETYCIDFKNRWYKNNNYNTTQFLKENSNNVWSIQNIQKCGQFLWFNSNTEELYCLDTSNNQCYCYNNIIYDTIPYASQLIVPQQGLKNTISFCVMPEFIFPYLKNVEKHHLEEQEGQTYSLAKSNLLEKNAMITFWEIK